MVNCAMLITSARRRAERASTSLYYRDWKYHSRSDLPVLVVTANMASADSQQAASGGGNGCTAIV